MFENNPGVIASGVWWRRCAKQAAIVIAITSPGLAASCQSARQRPITTPQAAVAIAKNSWNSVYDKTRSPTYSKEETGRFEPYTATLRDGIWTVKGTVPPGYRGAIDRPRHLG
jgi:hypothetical protein